MNLFGPIFRWELVRIARRRRITLSRCTFALALFLLATVVYWIDYQESRRQWSLRHVAQLTEGLFYLLFGILFVAGAVFTPSWTGDTITLEKERRTLPFLLVTDLSSREIILGKLASRLVQLVLFLLAALPILVGLQFFGGVEPAIVLLGAAGLAVTVWSIGGLTMVTSVYTRTPRAAAQRAGQVAALYVVGTMMADQILRRYPGVAGWPAGSPFTVYDLLDWLNVANPLVAVQTIANAAGMSFRLTLLSVFAWYSAAHLALGFAFVAWAIVRLRPVAAKAPLDGPPAGVNALAPRQHPPVGDRPVFWKMLYCDIRTWRTPLARAIVRGVYLLSFAPLFLILALSAYYGGGSVAEPVNVYTRMAVTVVLCGMLFYVAALTAGCIGRERTKQTLDDLLLTDLTADEILRQKWWASIWSVRWMWLWVWLHWLVALMVEGIAPPAVAAVALLWMIYLVYAANLGLYFAVRMPTAQQANLWTTATGMAIAIAPILIGMMGLLLSRTKDTWILSTFMAFPPAALGTAAYRPGDLAGLPSADAQAVVGGIVVSGMIYAVLAAVLWRGAHRLFPFKVRMG